MQIVWSKRRPSPKPTDGAPMETTELIRYLSSDLFIPEVKATSKDALFEEFADRFVKAKLVRKKEIVLEMLHKRETLGSTGIGKGVAIPHGRTTAALEVKIAFGKSEKGLEFDAVDKKPVHLIFMVMAPPHDENNRYLPILGKLVEVLSENKNRKKLMQVKTFEELVEVIRGAE